MKDIEIEVHEETLEVRNKKSGQGTYSLQKAYAHLTDRSNNPDRYPREIMIFPPRDNQNNPAPYKKGSYTLAPSSFRVGNNGQLEIGFVNLLPVNLGK